MIWIGIGGALILQAFLLWLITTYNANTLEIIKTNRQLWEQYKLALHQLSERAAVAEKNNHAQSALSAASEANIQALKARDEEVRFLRSLVKPSAASEAYSRTERKPMNDVDEELGPQIGGRWGLRETSSWSPLPDPTDDREAIKS